MRRDAVDFSAVSPEHADIDRRLANWARWSNNRGGGTASPMFRLYRSTEQWAQETTGSPIDAIDAQKVQKAVSQLPTKHRLALSWCYIRKNNPRKAAESLGESLEGLMLLVANSRQMLINRRV